MNITIIMDVFILGRLKILQIIYFEVLKINEVIILITYTYLGYFVILKNVTNLPLSHK